MFNGGNSHWKPPNPKLCELERATARSGPRAADICSRRYPTNDDINRRHRRWSGVDFLDAATYGVAAVQVSNGHRRRVNSINDQ